MTKNLRIKIGTIEVTAELNDTRPAGAVTILGRIVDDTNASKKVGINRGI